MDTVTEIEICWSLYRQGVSPEKIPEEVGRHRATVYRWLKKIKRDGIRQFVRDFRAAKKGRRQRKTDAVLKDRVYKIRETKRQCCGEKIQYYLHRDYGSLLGVSTIYRILKQKYELRNKWRKNLKRGKVMLQGSRPREVLQVDSVDLGGLYAFTAIDTFTREARVVIRTSLTAKDGEEALIEQLRFFGKVEGIQRDGGAEFSKRWEEEARKHAQNIRTAKPYKKNEQAFIERFNGILRKECVGYRKYRKDELFAVQRLVDEFLNYYHYDRPHLSLNMLTPNQFAMSHLR